MSLSPTSAGLVLTLSSSSGHPSPKHSTLCEAGPQSPVSKAPHLGLTSLLPLGFGPHVFQDAWLHPEASVTRSHPHCGGCPHILPLTHMHVGCFSGQSTGSPRREEKAGFSCVPRASHSTRGPLFPSPAPAQQTSHKPPVPRGLRSPDRCSPRASSQPHPRATEGSSRLATGCGWYRCL